MTVYTPARPAVGCRRSMIENFIDKNRDQVYCYENREGGKSEQVFLIHGIAAQELLNQVGNELEMLDRDTCEKDHTHVHLITYVGLVLSTARATPGSSLVPRVGLGPLSSYDCGNDGSPLPTRTWPDAGLFSYTRSKQGAEGRLFGKRSIGIGGHVERIIDGSGSIYRTLGACLRQELEEEVGLFSLLEPAPVRRYMLQLVENILTDIYRSSEVVVIYEPSSEVGRHHLGVYVPLVLNSHAMTKFEDTIAEPTLHVFTDLPAEPLSDEELGLSRTVSEPITRDLFDVPVFQNIRGEDWEAWSAALLDYMLYNQRVINMAHQVTDQQRLSAHDGIPNEYEEKGFHLKNSVVRKTAVDDSQVEPVQETAAE